VVVDMEDMDIVVHPIPNNDGKRFLQIYIMPTRFEITMKHLAKWVLTHLVNMWWIVKNLLPTQIIISITEEEVPSNNGGKQCPRICTTGTLYREVDSNHNNTREEEDIRIMVYRMQLCNNNYKMSTMIVY